MTQIEIDEIALSESKAIAKAYRIAEMKVRGINTFQSERDLSLNIEAMHRDTISKVGEPTTSIKELKYNSSLK